MAEIESWNTLVPCSNDRWMESPRAEERHFAMLFAFLLYKIRGQLHKVKFG